jgi:hypothetical protein
MGMSAVARFVVWSGVVCVLPTSTFAQSLDQRPQVQVVRIDSGTIRVDGTLGDAVWNLATPATQFTQREPNEGTLARDRMEVRFLYDDGALYVGARMHSSQPVQASLSRRDDPGQAEFFAIALDTYLDRRTAYGFGVTAAGVRVDVFFPTDNQDRVETDFDPVWEARTVVTEGGWTAEFRIPFSQLRFNSRDENVWGLNIMRYIPSAEEEVYWSLVERTQSGWASRFGDLRGLDEITPPLRLEVLPYLAGSSRISSERDSGNPFDDGTASSGRTGADVKYGIGSNLTLDVAVNPDFGQIDADPADVNLTVFETFFTERRPFFLEGSNVLRAGTGNYYYSRRIGARPTGPASGDYVDYPETTTILGAAKLTGRLPSGTSVGFLTAVTDDETARLFSDGRQSEVGVAPRTIWGLARVIQEFGDQGSTVGAHLTSVHRDFEETDPLALLQSRNAVTLGGDTNIRFADRTYEVRANVGLTHIDGEPEAIAGYQRRNGHLFHRVDQETIRFDETSRSMNGAQITASLNKIAGRHWLWGYRTMIESPAFEPMDFGRLNFAGDIEGGPTLTYRETIPGRFLRSYSTSIGLHTYTYFDADLGSRHSIRNFNRATFLNFWSTSFNVTRFYRGQDPQRTRGGPSMGVPRGWSVSWDLQNRAGAETQWSGFLNYESNELGDYTSRYGVALSVRPATSLQLSAEPQYRNGKGTRATIRGPINRQYLTSLPGGSAASYGRRYVFGFPDRTELALPLRASYTFKPDLTLDVYAEPFASSGRYERFGELVGARLPGLRVYGTDGTRITRLPDGRSAVTDGDQEFVLPNYEFNIRSFRSNVVLRWEWRPGSFLYAVWQQNRDSRLSEGQHVGLSDLFGSLSASGDNIFAIKTSFWFSR